MFSTWADGTAARHSSEQHTQSISASPEDVTHLQLSQSKVKVLKKTLFYFSRLYTEIRDHDIFVVSWNVHNIPKPPDDLYAILPPESWVEPDIIVFGLRNVPGAFLESWISTCHASVAEYRLEFQLLTSRPIVEANTVLLVYSKSFVVAENIDIRTIASTFSAVACRFSLHQAPICIVNLNFNDSIVNQSESEDADRSNVDKDQASLGASQHQQFKTLMDRMQFDVGGRVYGIQDHPVVLFLGCKDTMIDYADQDNVMARNYRVQYPILKRLKTLDLRFSPNIFGQLELRKFRGGLDVIKAGAIRLVMEVDSVNERRIASPEVALLRVGVPSVDTDRLRRLYRAVWRSLKNGEEESTSVHIDPPIIEHPSIRPFVPTFLKFVIRNSNKTPAAFSILCLSENGINLVPISTHSFLHRAKLGNSKARTSLESLSSRKTSSTDEQRSETTPTPVLHNTTAMSIAVDLQRKFISLKKKADRNLQGMLTRRHVSTSAKSCNRVSKYLSSADPEGGPNDLRKEYSTTTVSVKKKTSNLKKGWWGKLGWTFSNPPRKDGEIDFNRSNTKQPQMSFGTPMECTVMVDHRITSNERFSCSALQRSKNEFKGFDDTHQIVTTALLKNPNLSSIGSLEQICQSTGKDREYREANQTSLQISVEPTQVHVSNQIDSNKDGSDHFATHQSLSRSRPGSSTDTSRHVSIDIPQIQIPSPCNSPFENQRLPLTQRKNKQFDLSRWVLVEPSEGVMLGGNEIEINITILVQQGLMEITEIPSLILAVRVDKCKSNSFFSLRTKIIPSLHGLSIHQLEMLGYEPFRQPKDYDVKHKLIIPYEANPPEGKLIIPRNERQLPIPKELWWLLAEIYERITNIGSSNISGSQFANRGDEEFRMIDFLKKSGQTSLSSQITSQMRIIVSLIETGIKIPQNEIKTISLLLVLEEWANELSVPIIPCEFVIELDHDSSHLLCRAVLLSLPMSTRNLFIAILSLSRHLMRREIVCFDANERLLKIAVTEWLSRLLLRDTKPALAVSFMTHFIDDSNTSIFNEQ